MASVADVIPHSSPSTIAVSLLPCATDCVVSLGLRGVLAGRTHECTGQEVAALPVLTKSKLAPTSSLLVTPPPQASGEAPSSRDAHGPSTPLGTMTPAETHLAQSTLRAAAWELSWGVGVSSAFGGSADAQGVAGQSFRPGEGGVSRGASLLVEWALAPYLTDPWLLRKLQPDVVLTQLQPVEGAFGEAEIRAALAEVVGKPVMVLHLDPRSLGGVFDDLSRIGRSLGAQSAATRALRAMQDRISLVKSMCSGRPRKRVLCLQWLDPVFTAGAWVPELIRLAGGVPVGPGLADRGALQSGSAAWGSEGVAMGAGTGAEEAAQELSEGDLTRSARVADVLVLAICGCNVAESMRQVQDLLQRKEGAFGAAIAALRLGEPKKVHQHGERELEETPDFPAVLALAAAGGRKLPVAVVDGSVLFSRPGPALVPSVEVLAEILHPEVQRFGHEGKLWQFAFT